MEEGNRVPLDEFPDICVAARSGDEMRSATHLGESGAARDIHGELHAADEPSPVVLGGEEVAEDAGLRARPSAPQLDGSPARGLQELRANRVCVVEGLGEELP